MRSKNARRGAKKRNLQESAGDAPLFFSRLAVSFGCMAAVIEHHTSMTRRVVLFVSFCLFLFAWRLAAFVRAKQQATRAAALFLRAR